MTSFVLNGTQHTITPEPGLTVLDYLRLEARLTATKEGCAEGDCGACTIVIGERQGEGLAFSAVNACIMRAADLDGRVVLTAEGLAGEDAPHPAQQAIVAFHASQCGFCTPGFVMSFYALTQSPAPETPAARRALILDALAGNLCRCTGYRPLIDAAEALPHAADPRISAWRAALDALPPPTGPATLDELASRLARQPAARLTAGTTDIGVGIAKYGNIPADMLSVRNIPELRNVGWEGDELVIGAAATYSQILPFLDQALPNFAALIRRLGSVQIRNIGTMGGNICNASPIGDSAPCLIALGATLVLRSAAGERALPVEDFFTGYRKTARAPGEFLRAIRIPRLAGGETFFAYKLAKRFDQDISTVAAAFKLHIAGDTIIHARAGFGGLAATPLRGHGIEAAFAGKPLEAGTFARAAAEVETHFAPISDVRATAAYRLAATAGLLHRLGEDALQAGAVTDIFAL